MDGENGGKGYGGKCLTSTGTIRLIRDGEEGGMGGGGRGNFVFTRLVSISESIRSKSTRLTKQTD